MSDLVKDLKSKEESIRNLQQKQQRLEGKKEQLLSSLKEEFNISTLKKGEELLETKEAELKTQEAEAQKLLEEMEEIINIANGD